MIMTLVTMLCLVCTTRGTGHCLRGQPCWSNQEHAPTPTTPKEGTLSATSDLSTQWNTAEIGSITMSLRGGTATIASNLETTATSTVTRGPSILPALASRPGVVTEMISAAMGSSAPARSALEVDSTSTTSEEGTERNETEVVTETPNSTATRRSSLIPVVRTYKPQPFVAVAKVSATRLSAACGSVMRASLVIIVTMKW